MPTILHFLNGDSTKHIFDQTEIAGNVAVIRETFCAGPLHPLFDHDFWNERQDWFNRNYFVSSDTYSKKVKNEFHQAQKGYDEIVIWYEYDVYCQINMLGYLNWVIQHTSSKISLVYSTAGLGRLTPSSYCSLFDNRTVVTDQMKTDCRSIWQSIAQKDTNRLAALSARHLSDLPNMSNALRCYQHQNFGQPSLRPLQLRVRSIIQSGITNGKQIIKRMLQLDHIFGYGDYQYLLILTAMSDELVFDPITANSMEACIDAVHSSTFSIK